MQTIDIYLAKVGRYLWLVALYLGLSAVYLVVSSPFSWEVGYIAIFGVLNLINSYSLFKKISWGWRLTFFTAIFNLLFFLIYPVILGIFLNVVIAYTSYRFRERLGGSQEDKIIPKSWFSRIKP